MILSTMLRWSHPTQCDGYKIFRKLSTDVLFPVVPLAVKPANCFFYQDAAVAEGITYNYKIVAFNGFPAVDSTIQTATLHIPVTPTPAAPAPVTDFTAEVDNNNN